ncbi:MAG: hypothetical protein IJF92_00780 [Bacilli bacterium]|nr:hypothetical protein [Bacilli bacterium]MBQ3307651.1 hypothetical protein [Bacilli bacterium]
MNYNMSKEVRVCPICKKKYSEHPALSRVDNKTEICSACGLAEAWSDYIKYYTKTNKRSI